MSEPTPSKTTPQLKKAMKTQTEEIGKLRRRINELVDNMAVLENDLDIFKKNVSKDLLEVIDVIKEKQK